MSLETLKQQFSRMSIDALNVEQEQEYYQTLIHQLHRMQIGNKNTNVSFEEEEEAMMVRLLLSLKQSKGSVIW
jgi:hypothetical protein